jgi:hypothetical protein
MNTKNITHFYTIHLIYLTTQKINTFLINKTKINKTVQKTKVHLIKKLMNHKYKKKLKIKTIF